MSVTATCTRPRSAAFPRMLSARYPDTIRGNSVRTSAFSIGLLRELGRTDHHPPAVYVDGEDVLVRERHQELFLARTADHQIRHRARLPDLLDQAERGALLVDGGEADQIALEVFALGGRL